MRRCTVHKLAICSPTRPSGSRAIIVVRFVSRYANRRAGTRRIEDFAILAKCLFVGAML